MAGNYPDAPGHRMPYDADGSIGLVERANLTGPFTALTPTQQTELNDEDNAFAVGGANFTTTTIAIIFPELRDLDGVFTALNGSGFGAFQTSTDSTNGLDGTWTTRVADLPNYNAVYTQYRTGITSLAVTAQRAIRAQFFDSFSALGLHLYGEISAGETPDRLLFIDEVTGLEFTGPLDYGNVPRGSSEDRQFRLKNNSATLPATLITYTAEALYLAGGSWFTFTLPGGATFAASQSPSNIPAATTTGIITVRRITPALETLGPHAPRFRVTATY